MRSTDLDQPITKGTLLADKRFIITEGALRRPLTYDDYPIHPIHSEMARHSQISLDFIQFDPGCSRRVHYLDPSQPPMN